MQLELPPELSGKLITNETWNFFAEAVSTKGDPQMHSPAAMERLMRAFKDDVIRMRTPSGKFHARNKCVEIAFPNDAGRRFYEQAFERYLEEKARVSETPSMGRMQQLVAENKFLAAADLVRAEVLAVEGDRAVKDGYAAVLVCRNRPTIAKLVRLFTSPQFGYTRDDISLIWGGDDLYSKSARLTAEQIRSILDDMAVGKPVSSKNKKLLTRQLQESAEDTLLVESSDNNLRLGNQNKKQRQSEIDRFQTGKTKICIFTYSAGGVGLSLHHTDHDDLGNPVVLRPRRTFLGPTYSAQDFVQGLGRAHRSIFSLSDTIQTIMFFSGTIEMKVMRIVSKKLKCLSKVIQARESWQSAILKADSNDIDDVDRAEQSDLMNRVGGPQSEDSSDEVDEALMGGGDEDDDEESED